MVPRPAEDLPRKENRPSDAHIVSAFAMGQ